MKTRIFFALPCFVISAIMTYFPPPSWGAPMGVAGLALIQIGSLFIGVAILAGMIDVGNYSWKQIIGKLWLIPIIGFAIFALIFCPMYTISTDKVETHEYIGRVSATEYTGIEFFGDARTIFHFSDGQLLRVDGNYQVQPSKTYRFVYDTHTNLQGIIRLQSIEEIQ